MFYNVLIAGFLTLGIYIVWEFVKSFRQFLIFKKVRMTILLSIFQYLKKTPQKYVDLQNLKHDLEMRLIEQQMMLWVKAINISWHTVNSIEFVLELNFEKISPKYKFVIGLDEFEKNQ